MCLFTVIAMAAQVIHNFLLNSLESSVRDNLIGLALANPNIQVAEHVDAILRKDVHDLRDKGHVLVISGGGAGHEPMFAGFVGPRMLTAAVSGSYFASPSAGKIITVVKEIAKCDTPILFIVANYTGDRLNFGLAKEHLMLQGYKDVRLFVFGDDLAPYLSPEIESEDLQRKRRGLAGIAFVHMVAGVLSEQGKSLDDIELRLRQLSKLIYTISISLSACDIPGHGASFQLESDQMELGLGVHGESGVKRVPLATAHDVIDLLTTHLITFLRDKDLLRHDNNRIALIINNLGGLTQIEMNVLLKEVLEQMSAKGVTVCKVIYGTVMTSFNMKGVSLSVLILDEQLQEILEQTMITTIIHSGLLNAQPIYRFKHSLQVDDLNEHIRVTNYCEHSLYVNILRNACQKMIKHEHELNKLDEAVGDSDCGSTLSAIARLFLDQIQLNPDLPPPSFATLAQLVSERIGGSSGALYSLLFAAASNHIKQHEHTFARSYLSLTERVRHWLELMQHCMRQISTYSGAQVGDRSMLDALHGIVIGLQNSVQQTAGAGQALTEEEICRLLVECTWTQARKTATMTARVGRAAYVNVSLLTKPDAGAIGVAIWIEAIAETLLQTFTAKRSS